MSKKLSEMTLEELWHLFPIQLREYDDNWNKYYEEMKFFLLEELNAYDNIRINHIGSTAIRGICSKPIVDIMIEVDSNIDINVIASRLEGKSFIIMSKAHNRASLNMGYTEKGFADKVFHIHLRLKGDNDELYFRDYLNEFPNVAKQYEKLKLDIWKKYEFNRDGYTNAKADFIKEYTSQAKSRYGNRYH